MTDDHKPAEDHPLFEAGQIAPHSQEAEEAVLGSILINPDAYLHVVGFLTSDDFFILRNEWVFEAMQRLHERGDRLEFLTVVEELKTQGRLTDIGGSAYVTYLASNTATSVHAEVYGRIVERAAIRRRMLEAAGVLTEAARTEDEPVHESINAFEADYAEVKQRVFRHKDGGLRSVAEAFEENTDDSDANYEAYKASIAARFKMGWPDLDAIVNVSRGEFILFGARTGAGKSAALQTIVYNAMISRFVVAEKLDNQLHLPLPDGRYIRMPTPEDIQALPRIALFSLEMSAPELAKRWAAMMTGIGVDRQNNGRISRAEFGHLQDAKTLLKMLDLKLLLMCKSTTVEAMAAECRIQKPDVIITDYIQLFGTTQSVSGDVERISAAAKVHKGLAMELGIPVFSAAQVNRAGDHGPDRGPTLKELKGSGALEEDADTVILMHRPEQSDENRRPGETDFNAAKHRNGKTGAVTLAFDGNRTLFRNPPQEQVIRFPAKAPACPPNGHKEPIL